MSYSPSVVTREIVVTVPTYVFNPHIVDTSVPESITGTIIVDGVSYSTATEYPYTELRLAAGRHTITVVIPAGWEFEQWVRSGGAFPDDPMATITGFILTDHGSLIAYVHPVVPVAVL